MNIIQFDSKCWADQLANDINEKIHQILNNNKKCSIVLTGGRCASVFYKSWSKFLSKEKRRIDFYFGDERCVKFDSIDSNYKNVFENLFNNFVPLNFSLNKININNQDLDNEILSYLKILPKNPDILFLSLGDDGHIASIFPTTESENTTSLIKISESPNHSHKRITIDYNYINQASYIYCFAIGKEKGKTLNEILKSRLEYKLLPAKFIINKAYWIVDDLAIQMIDIKS